MSQSTPPRATLGDSTTQYWVAGARETLGHDLYEGLRAWPMWSTLGWQDIRQRYRRSVLGPIWITLSMAILVGTLGVIYGRVFHTELKEYLPFLCLGFIIWGFISSCANECCTAFTASAGIIKQSKGAFSIHVLRVVWRNFIVFAHTFVIFVPVAIIGAGDSIFFQKAFARLENLAQQSCILVVATHADAIIRKLCNKAIWLHQGRLVEYGEVGAVLEAYQKMRGASSPEVRCAMA
jgi:hypothetical protein